MKPAKQPKTDIMSIQIRNLDTSNKTRAVAKAATLNIPQRKDGTHEGQFTLNRTLEFNLGGDLSIFANGP